MIESFNIYCLSHKNTERQNNIQNIFNKLNLNVIFYQGVGYDDDRIKNRNLDIHKSRCWSIMYGHLDMIQQFLNTDKEFGIFCENDILIQKDFNVSLDEIINNFKELKLDILLLGYLCSNNIHGNFYNFQEKKVILDSNFKYKYYDYDLREKAGVWGAQMYMLNRSHAKKILEIYSTKYADISITDNTMIPFATDWTITKCDVNRAIIFPIIAIENNVGNLYEDKFQQLARDGCHKLSYSGDYYS